MILTLKEMKYINSTIWQTVAAHYDNYNLPNKTRHALLD